MNVNYQMQNANSNHNPQPNHPSKSYYSQSCSNSEDNFNQARVTTTPNEKKIDENYGKTQQNSNKSNSNSTKSNHSNNNQNQNPNIEDIPSSPNSKKKKPFIERIGDWVCLKCRNLNFSFRVSCNRCQLSKIESERLFEQYMKNLILQLKFKDMLQNNQNQVVYNNSYYQNLYYTQYYKFFPGAQLPTNKINFQNLGSLGNLENMKNEVTEEELNKELIFDGENSKEY